MFTSPGRGRHLESQVSRCGQPLYLPDPQTLQIAAPYFFTVELPTPGTERRSSGVAGGFREIARRDWSLRIRNAGTPRFFASARRQARNFSSSAGLLAPDFASPETSLEVPSAFACFPFFALDAILR